MGRIEGLLALLTITLVLLALTPPLAHSASEEAAEEGPLLRLLGLPVGAKWLVVDGETGSIAVARGHGGVCLPSGRSFPLGEGVIYAVSNAPWRGVVSFAGKRLWLVNCSDGEVWSFPILGPPWTVGLLEWHGYLLAYVKNNTNQSREVITAYTLEGPVFTYTAPARYAEEIVFSPGSDALGIGVSRGDMEFSVSFIGPSGEVLFERHATNVDYRGIVVAPLSGPAPGIAVFHSYRGGLDKRVYIAVYTGSSVFEANYTTHKLRVTAAAPIGYSGGSYMVVAIARNETSREWGIAWLGISEEGLRVLRWETIKDAHTVLPAGLSSGVFAAAASTDRGTLVVLASSGGVLARILLESVPAYAVKLLAFKDRVAVLELPGKTLLYNVESGAMRTVAAAPAAAVGDLILYPLQGLYRLAEGLRLERYSPDSIATLAAAVAPDGGVLRLAVHFDGSLYLEKASRDGALEWEARIGEPPGSLEDAAIAWTWDRIYIAVSHTLYSVDWEEHIVERVGRIPLAPEELVVVDCCHLKAVIAHWGSHWSTAVEEVYPLWSEKAILLSPDARSMAVYQRSWDDLYVYSIDEGGSHVSGKLAPVSWVPGDPPLLEALSQSGRLVLVAPNGSMEVPRGGQHGLLPTTRGVGWLDSRGVLHVPTASGWATIEGVASAASSTYSDYILALLSNGSLIEVLEGEARALGRLDPSGYKLLSATTPLAQNTYSGALYAIEWEAPSPSKPQRPGWELLPHTLETLYTYNSSRYRGSAGLLWLTATVVLQGPNATAPPGVPVEAIVWYANGSSTRLAAETVEGGVATLRLGLPVGEVLGVALRAPNSTGLILVPPLTVPQVTGGQGSLGMPIVYSRAYPNGTLVVTADIQYSFLLEIGPTNALYGTDEQRTRYVEWLNTLCRRPRASAPEEWDRFLSYTIHGNFTLKLAVEGTSAEKNIAVPYTAGLQDSFLGIRATYKGRESLTLSGGGGASYTLVVTVEQPRVTVVKNASYCLNPATGAYSILIVKTVVNTYAPAPRTVEVGPPAPQSTTTTTMQSTTTRTTEATSTTTARLTGTSPATATTTGTRPTQTSAIATEKTGTTAATTGQGRGWSGGAAMAAVLIVILAGAAALLLKRR